jgi:hypothetical protein
MCASIMLDEVGMNVTFIGNLHYMILRFCSRQMRNCYIWYFLLHGHVQNSMEVSIDFEFLKMLQKILHKIAIMIGRPPDPADD